MSRQSPQMTRHRRSPAVKSVLADSPIRSCRTPCTSTIKRRNDQQRAGRSASSRPSPIKRTCAGWSFPPRAPGMPTNRINALRIGERRCQRWSPVAARTLRRAAGWSHQTTHDRPRPRPIKADRAAPRRRPKVAQRGSVYRPAFTECSPDHGLALLCGFRIAHGVGHSYHLRSAASSVRAVRPSTGAKAPRTSFVSVIRESLAFRLRSPRPQIEGPACGGGHG
jgi:hypothetical protein